MRVVNIAEIIDRDAHVMSWSNDGQTVEWQASWEHVTLDGIEVPAWVQEHRHGGGGPDLTIKAAIRDGVPEVVELKFTVGLGQSEIRQKHLRALEVDRVATDLYSGVLAAIKLDVGEDPTETTRLAQKFIENRRLPREYRVINDDFLKQVAEVYRKNIGRAPTKSVAKKFVVKDRMASTYVDKARKAGHLPPTKQGKKQA